MPHDANPPVWRTLTLLFPPAANPQVIVDGFNQPPFRKNLTLVQFDELSPEDLLVLMHEVFADLSPDHQLDMREEEREATAFRFGTFLRVLNYRQQNAQWSTPEVPELFTATRAQPLCRHCVSHRETPFSESRGLFLLSHAGARRDARPPAGQGPHLRCS